MLCLGGKRCSLSLMCDMGEQERSRINFCAKVFKAFGLNLTLLVDHRVVYQVGESWQCDNIEALERKAEQMLQYRQKLV